MWVGGLVGVGERAGERLAESLVSDKASPGVPAGAFRARRAFVAVGGLIAVADLALAAAMAGGDVALVADVASSDRR